MKSTLLCMILVCGCLGGQAMAATHLPALGATFPDLEITAPLANAQRQYLGLKRPLLSFLTPKSFALSDIAADILVVEFFNIYCTSCQAQAPTLNRLFAEVSADATLRDRVRFIGIGAGNNEREIAQFAETRQVPFPVVSDPEFIHYNAIGDPGGTPLIVILRRAADGAWETFASHFGLIREAALVRDQISQAARGAASVDATAPTRPAEDRMLTLAQDPEQQRAEVTAAILHGQPSGTRIESLASLTVPGYERVWQAQVRARGDRQCVYAVIISRKPVCDLCHGIHFIIVFNTAGTIVNFMPLHVTKWGNVAWDETDSAFMRHRLKGRSVLQPQLFDAQVDAVATATMSSALIVNSVNTLGSLRARLPLP